MAAAVPRYKIFLSHPRTLNRNINLLAYCHLRFLHLALNCAWYPGAPSGPICTVFAATHP